MLATLYRSKAVESADDQAFESYADVERRARKRQHDRRNFRDRIDRANGIALVAEVKHASPSAGIIVRDFDPVRLAQAYESGGADGVSVLTEHAHFKGCVADLDRVRSNTSRPILRKDFLSTRYEIAQSAAYGADAVLLIVAGLTDVQLAHCLSEAARFDLDALVEIHSEQDLGRALAAGATLLGINNRNLQTFQTDLAVSERLLPLIPQTYTTICESGIRTAADIARLTSLGARGFLVGETLLRSPDPAREILDLKRAVATQPA